MWTLLSITKIKNFEDESKENKIGQPNEKEKIFQTSWYFDRNVDVVADYTLAER